jgi:hypothetical protein
LELGLGGHAQLGWRRGEKLFQSGVDRRVLPGRVGGASTRSPSFLEDFWVSGFLGFGVCQAPFVPGFLGFWVPGFLGLSVRPPSFLGFWVFGFLGFWVSGFLAFGLLGLSGSASCGTCAPAFDVGGLRQTDRPRQQCSTLLSTRTPRVAKSLWRQTDPQDSRSAQGLAFDWRDH